MIALAWFFFSVAGGIGLVLLAWTALFLAASRHERARDREMEGFDE